MNTNTLFYLRKSRPEFEEERQRVIAIMRLMRDSEHEPEDFLEIMNRINRKLRDTNRIAYCEGCQHFDFAFRTRISFLSEMRFCNSPYCMRSEYVDGERAYVGTDENMSDADLYLCETCSNWNSEGVNENNECESCEESRREREEQEEREREEEENRVIHEYHAVCAERVLNWYPARDGAKTEKLPYLGIELEVEVTGDLRDTAERVLELLDPHCILAEDCTINHGFEIISSPHTLIEHYRGPWDRIMNGKMRGITAGKEHIGLHVNLSRSSVSTLECGKIYYYLNRHFPLVEKIARRKETRYCKYIKDIRKIRDPRDSEEYQALEVKDQVLEFRMFRSTLNDLFFFASLEAVLALRKLAQNASMKELDNASSFLEASKSKEFPALSEYLVHLGYFKKPTRKLPAYFTQDGLFPVARKEF